MELKEIINRSDNIPIEQDEALFVIKEYIKIRKDVDIEPKINANHGRINTIVELQLMTSMVAHAIMWLRENLK